MNKLFKCMYFDLCTIVCTTLYCTHCWEMIYTELYSLVKGFYIALKTGSVICNNTGNLLVQCSANLVNRVFKELHIAVSHSDEPLNHAKDH